MLLRILLVITLCVFTGCYNVIYVAPYPEGKPPSEGGTGTEDHPINLKTALTNSELVEPGSIVLIKGGVYNAPSEPPFGGIGYIANISGTADEPIQYIADPGQQVTLTLKEGDGVSSGYVLWIPNTTEYVWFLGLEVTSERNTGVPIPGTRELRDAAVYLEGSNCKLIDLIIHDNPDRTGICPQTTMSDQEIYGCIIYRNGEKINGIAGGHGIYAQNFSSDHPMTITECLIFDNYGAGLCCYSGAGNDLDLEGFDINGVASWGNVSQNFLIYKERRSTKNIKMRDCYSYYQNPRVHYAIELGDPSRDFLHGFVNRDLTFENNVSINGLYAVRMTRWESVTFQNNTLYTGSAGDVRPGGPAALNVMQAIAPAASTVDNNTYYFNYHEFSPSRHFAFVYDILSDSDPILREVIGISDIETWRNKTKQWDGATGWDENSHFYPYSPFNPPPGVPPNPPLIDLRPDKYIPTLAHLIIYNWPKGDVSVDLGLGGFCEEREPYSIYNVDDIWGTPIATGTYDGTPVSIEMTDIEFACYLVIKR
jgi:hypothetical protein